MLWRKRQRMKPQTCSLSIAVPLLIVGMLRDQAFDWSSREHMLPSVAVKGINIKYEPGAAEFTERMFGFRPADDDLACLAGALDGATVNVSVRVKKGWLYLAVDDSTRFEVYETSVRCDAQGELFAYIHEVRVAVGQGGQGLGIRAFCRQVSGAQSLGIIRFELWAAGDVRDTSHNGYYTWGRFGFDALLRNEKRFLPFHLSQSQTINDVILSGAQAWWKQHGSERSMVFDLADDSSMMAVLRAYRKEKGLPEE